MPKAILSHETLYGINRDEKSAVGKIGGLLPAQNVHSISAAERSRSASVQTRHQNVQSGPFRS